MCVQLFEWCTFHSSDDPIHFRPCHAPPAVRDRNGGVGAGEPAPAPLVGRPTDRPVEDDVVGHLHVVYSGCTKVLIR